MQAENYQLSMEGAVGFSSLGEATYDALLQQASELSYPDVKLAVAVCY
jgi:uncharacterized alpha/beta hydrolase family protein